jgi:MFS family permease
MTEGIGTAAASGDEAGSTRLAILLSMAMFVLVVDTSLMNVSISAVVRDLHTTVSGVQSAIALEALVSAAFILIGGKVGDLIGRKRAYVLGLLAYAVGALSMALGQSLTAIIVFWAIVGGLGASLLLPAMQSLIHGNFEGAAQKKAYAMVGAAAAIAAAVGPLVGASSRRTCPGASPSPSRTSSSRSCSWGSAWFAMRRTRAPGAWTWSAPSFRSWAWAASSSGSSSGRKAVSTWVP